MKSLVSHYKKTKASGQELIHSWIAGTVLASLRRWVFTKKANGEKANLNAVIEQALIEFMERHS